MPHLVDKRVWGKNGWNFMYAVSAAFPDQPTAAQQRQYAAFFRLLPSVLPCVICRGHFAEQLRAAPVEAALGSRRSLLEWVLARENHVSRTYGSGKERTYPELVAELYPEGMTSWAALADEAEATATARARRVQDGCPPVKVVLEERAGAWGIALGTLAGILMVVLIFLLILRA